jgi:hypothetical protein
MNSVTRSLVCCFSSPLRCGPSFRVTEADIKKLIRDAKERNIAVGIIVAKDVSQLRQPDRDCRWGQEDGVWVLRTTRQWLPRDLDVLRPLLERMRTDGPDFLQRNTALAEEVRRTFADIDAIEKELGKASKAIQSEFNRTLYLATSPETDRCWKPHAERHPAFSGPQEFLAALHPLPGDRSQARAQRGVGLLDAVP